MKAPGMPTAAEVRAKIEDAERAILAATIALGEALVVKQALPDRDVSPEQDTVDAARRTVDQLKAMLPIVERFEAEALAGTRAQLADDQRRGLERALRDLLKHSMSFSVHYSNAASAFRRMASSGAAASRLLFDAHRTRSNGYLPNRLSSAGLKTLAVQEINRLGHRLDGGISAPGTTAVPSNFFRQLPLPLEQEIRNLTKLIMASAPEPLPRPQESADGASLPQVAAKPSPSLTASAEPQGAE